MAWSAGMVQCLADGSHEFAGVPGSVVKSEGNQRCLTLELLA